MVSLINAIICWGCALTYWVTHITFGPSVANAYATFLFMMAFAEWEERTR